MYVSKIRILALPPRAFTCFILVHYLRNISPKHGSALNTRSNDFTHSILNVWCHVSGEITLGVAMRGDSGVAGEERVVGVPKFRSWGTSTMPITNINSDWMSNASSGLRINHTSEMIYHHGASLSKQQTADLFYYFVMVHSRIRHCWAKSNEHI